MRHKAIMTCKERFNSAVVNAFSILSGVGLAADAVQLIARTAKAVALGTASPAMAVATAVVLSSVLVPPFFAIGYYGGKKVMGFLSPIALGLPSPISKRISGPA
jgi:hypothetical protein